MVVFFPFSPLVLRFLHSSAQNRGRTDRGGNEVIVLVDVMKSRGLELSFEWVAFSLPVDFLGLLHDEGTFKDLKPHNGNLNQTAIAR